MSANGYSVRMILEQSRFGDMLRFLQAHNADSGYAILFTGSVGPVRITTDSPYCEVNQQRYTLEAPETAIPLPFPLHKQWAHTFNCSMALKLPVDTAFQRYLLSDHFNSRSWRPDDPYRHGLLDDGMARVGRLIIRARGLEHIKPGFVETEFLVLIGSTFLQESAEWRRWLLRLAEQVGAELAYIQEDYERFTILWHRNQPVTLGVQNYDDMPDAETALAASKVLARAVYSNLW